MEPLPTALFAELGGQLFEQQLAKQPVVSVYAGRFAGYEGQASGEVRQNLVRVRTVQGLRGKVGSHLPQRRCPQQESLQLGIEVQIGLFSSDIERTSHGRHSLVSGLESSAQQPPKSQRQLGRLLHERQEAVLWQSPQLEVGQRDNRGGARLIRKQRHLPEGVALLEQRQGIIGLVARAGTGLGYPGADDVDTVARITL